MYRDFFSIQISMDYFEGMFTNSSTSKTIQASKEPRRMYVTNKDYVVAIGTNQNSVYDQYCPMMMIYLS